MLDPPLDAGVPRDGDRRVLDEVGGMDASDDWQPGLRDEVLASFLALMRAARSLKQGWLDSGTGLSPAQQMLLADLARLESVPGDGGGDVPAGRPPSGARLKDLAAVTGLDASTVSREAARLIELGLVERRRDLDDGRASRLVRTESGRAAWQRCHEVLGDLMQESLSGVPEAEVRTLARSLQRLADVLDLTTTRLVTARPAASRPTATSTAETSPAVTSPVTTRPAPQPPP